MRPIDVIDAIKRLEAQVKWIIDHQENVDTVKKNVKEEYVENASKENTQGQ
jgi:hypothetical protein